jgi:hypothetical protein
VWLDRLQSAVLLQGPDRVWIDTVSVASDGDLYAVANQPSRQSRYHEGRDLRRRPYLLFRVPMAAVRERVFVNCTTYQGVPSGHFRSTARDGGRGPARRGGARLGGAVAGVVGSQRLGPARSGNCPTRAVQFIEQSSELLRRGSRSASARVANVYGCSPVLWTSFRLAKTRLA